jgi:hypothetical protein
MNLNIITRSFSILTKIFSILQKTPLNIPKKEEQQLIAELRENITRLSAAHPSTGPSANEVWDDFSKRLRTLILNEDPRRFLQWKIIKQTMFASGWYCYSELRYLRSQTEWSSRWKPGLQEGALGQPTPFPFYLQSSSNLIHHAYHIAQFEEKTGVRINNLNFIFEFGGGYGSLCRFIKKLAYGGPYVIYDLPEFSALQEFFLKGSNLPVGCFSEMSNSRDEIFLINRIQDLRLSLIHASTPSLFIATWSISETPLKFREEILDLTRSFDNFLIAYADTFGGVDNVTFFKEWSRSFGEEITWFDWPIEHLPGNRYLIGMRKTTQNC